MSSKPKGNAEPQAISGQAVQTRAPSVGNAERDQEIRRRAYEIYPQSVRRRSNCTFKILAARTVGP